MPWVRLADDFPDHPKVVRAGPLAAWLYVCGLSYANRYATDGFIPAAQVRRLADVSDAGPLAERLVDAGLWERADDGFQIHDYRDYQPSADEVKREREAAARRQAEYRARRAEARNAARNGDGDALLTHESRPSRATGAPEPGPARPGPDISPAEIYPPLASQEPPHGGNGADALPKPKARTSTPRADSGQATDFPETLDPSETDYAAGAEVGLSRAEVDAKVPAMLDHWRARGEVRADWHASLRTWLRNAPKFDVSRAPPNGHSGTVPSSEPYDEINDPDDIMPRLVRRL